MSTSTRRVPILSAYWRPTGASSCCRKLPRLYEIQRRDAEGTVQAEMVTAYPASESQQAEIIASLRKRLGREIELSCSTDAGLLGGAIIRAGDLVIDGSVRGKLQRLGTALNH